MELITNTAKSYSLSCEEYINIALDFCRVNRLSCAAWRLPLESNIHLIIDFYGTSEVGTMDMEGLQEGFLFAPFDKSKKALYVNSDLHIDITNQEIQSLSTDKIDSFTNFLDEAQTKIYKAQTSNQIKKVEVSDSSNFINLVGLAINEIKSGAFQKVVPSRNKKILLENGLDSGVFFADLCDTYNNAFVSLVFDPINGLWLGATPELLLEVGNNKFRTVALAGTQKYEGQELSDVAWTQKEIEEQAFVSRYIINCFKKIRLREFDENGPKTIKAGNLIHLKTEFSVDMQNTNFPDLGSVMLELLHPTSAICGMPLEPALEFLMQNEHYNREYFSGFLGPVEFQNKTSLFVNLRCMKAEGNEVTIFAGAGVTEDSRPEKEWQETEMKMNTLLNLFN